MPVRFAGKRQAELPFVLALWHELMSAWHPEIEEPMAVPMRRRHAMEGLARLLRADGEVEGDAPRATAGRACGVDIVLRLASGQIDTMHATSQFFERAGNADWFTPVPMPDSGLAGVRLTDAAIAVWKDMGETARERALEQARRLLESDIESGGIIVRLLPRQEVVRAPAARTAQASDRMGHAAANRAVDQSGRRRLHAAPAVLRYRDGGIKARAGGRDGRGASPAGESLGCDDGVSFGELHPARPAAPIFALRRPARSPSFPGPSADCWMFVSIHAVKARSFHIR